MVYSRADQDADLAQNEQDQRSVIVRVVHVVVRSVLSHGVPHGEQHCAERVQAY